MGGHYYADSDDDDDSSCDDTYVSMSSARGSEKGRILKETSRVSNKPRPSSSSTLKSSKHKYDKYGESSSSTAGILDKLKNDINSLERLRQATATDFSDSSFERGEAYNRSQSSMRAGNTEFSSSQKDTNRSRSVDRFFRDADPGESSARGQGAGRPPTAGDGGSPWQKRKERAIGNDEMNKKVKALETENERLQETVRILKEDSIKNIEHNEKKLSKMSQVKLLLEKSKSKEADLERALREVISNIESEQEMMAEELTVAYKLRTSEVTLLEERLKSLQEDKDEAEHNLREELESLKSSIKSKENSWMEKESNLNKELYQLKSAYSELVERTRQITDNPGNAANQKRNLQDNIAQMKQEGEEVVTAVNKAFHKAREENKIMSEKLDAATTENSSHKKTIDEKTEILTKLETSLTDAAEEHRKDTETLSKLEAENGSLKNTINEKTEAHNTLELALAEANVLKADMELGLNNLKATLESEMHKLEDEKEERNALQKKMATIEDERKEQAAQIEYLMATIAESKPVHDEMQTDLRIAKKEIDTLKGKNQVKDKQLVDMNKATKLMHKKVHDLETEMARNETEANKLKSELDRAKANLGESETKANIMNQEISSLQSELLSTNERLQASREGNSELQKEIKAQASGAQDKELKLKETVKMLKSELDGTKKKLEQTEDNLVKIQKESNSRNGQLKSALQSLDEMMKYIENMREENDDVVASLEGDLEKAIKVSSTSHFTYYLFNILHY